MRDKQKIFLQHLGATFNRGRIHINFNLETVKFPETLFQNVSVQKPLQVFAIICNTLDENVVSIKVPVKRSHQRQNLKEILFENMFFNKDMVAGIAIICTSTPKKEVGHQRLHFQEVLFTDMFFNKEMVTGTATICTSTPAKTLHVSNTSNKTSRESLSLS